jgi:hypothetical protein
MSQPMDTAKENNSEFLRFAALLHTPSEGTFKIFVTLKIRKRAKEKDEHKLQ